MSLPNGHFNQSSKPFNPSPAAFEDGRPRSHAQGTTPARRFSFKEELKKTLKSPVRQAALGAVWYAWSGIAEAATFNAQYGIPEQTPLDAIFIVGLIGIPAALMVMRRGYVSAGILCAVAILNMLGTGSSWLAGDPDYGLSSVLYNVFFLGVFAHAARHLWQVRKR